MNHDQERFSAAAARLEQGITAGFFQGRRRSIDTKTDGSPVMEADTASKQASGDHIAWNFADDGILGEQFGISDKESRYRRDIDPIDGTCSLRQGLPFYSTLIGVESRESAGSSSVEAGVIHVPASRRSSPCSKRPGVGRRAERRTQRRTEKTSAARKG